MEYWQGWMNWPLDENWKCEVCGNRSLTWGVVHAQCRCDTCHTEYTMRSVTNRDIVLTTPYCMLKPTYLVAFRKYWKKAHIPVSKISDDDWDEILRDYKEVETSKK